jgi:hypothetical protein
MSGRRLPFALATGAVVWSVALITAAYVHPTSFGVWGDRGCSPSPSGIRCPTATSTNTGLVIFGGLAVLTVICWLGLHFRCATGSRVGLILGWTATSMTLGLSFISFGIGAYVAPMAIMMLFATLKTQKPATP